MSIDRSIITKADIELGFDAVAEKMYVSSEFYEEVLDIEQNFYGDILEPGVGQGVVLKYIKDKTKKRSITTLTGLDISSKLLEMARATIPDANLIKGDVEAMPFKDNVFDFVIMVNVFAYLLDFHKTLEEIRRVLRPKGVFIVTVPNKQWILFKEYIKRRKNIQPIDDHFFDYEEMKNLLEQHHFQILDFRGADCFRFYGWKHRYERVLAHIIPMMHKHMKHMVFRCINIK